MHALKGLTAVTLEHANAAPCASRPWAATRTVLAQRGVGAKDIARLRAAEGVCT